MALFLQHQGEDCHWAVWKLEETLEELLSLLPDSRNTDKKSKSFLLPIDVWNGALYVFCSIQYLEWKKKFDIKIVGNLIWLINRFL